MTSRPFRVLAAGCAVVVCATAAASCGSTEKQRSAHAQPAAGTPAAGSPSPYAAPRVHASRMSAPTPQGQRALEETPAGKNSGKEARSASGDSAVTKRAKRKCTVSKLLVPSCGAWWGVIPGAFTGKPKGKALAEFERKIGRSVDIFHWYHRGADIFPTKKEISIATAPGQERLLFLNWKPAMGHTWAEVARGVPEVDRHIDKLAAHIDKNFPHPFFLAIQHEPEDDVVARKGSGYTASDYRAMFRHVVERLRAGGADNAVIVMNYMGAPKWGVKPWFDELYPGDDVVDWIGYDPYAEPKISSFAELVNIVFGWVDGWPGFYTWATKNHPDKPLMLAEWGVFTHPDDPGHKPGVYRSMRKQVRDYPRVKAFVHFSSPKAPKGDTTVDSSPAALREFRKLSNMPYLNPPGPHYPIN